MTKTKDQWDEISYPNLTEDENELIRVARREGYADFYPSSSTDDSMDQSQYTLQGARLFLGDRVLYFDADQSFKNEGWQVEVFNSANQSILFLLSDEDVNPMRVAGLKVSKTELPKGSEIFEYANHLLGKKYITFSFL